MPKAPQFKSVSEFLENCSHPLKTTLEHLRQTILSTSDALSEHIKWNSPAYYFNGDMQDFDPKEYKRDIAVFNLAKQDVVLLVFPTGNKIPVGAFQHEENLKDGRKMLRFYNLAEAELQADALKALIAEWIGMVEK